MDETLVNAKKIWVNNALAVLFHMGNIQLFSLVRGEAIIVAMKHSLR